MHKILIVGHPSSKFKDVAALLNSYGMSEAKPSRRDLFLPAEITRIICEAHGVTEEAPAELDLNFSQLEVGSIWHGMALDLMLGNLDSKIWGWADAKSIHLLNYWRDLDPEVTFVLVYSNPEDVLLNNAHAVSLTVNDLESNIQHWLAFNEALLHFYNRNKDRCFLVHSQQIRASSNSYLLEIGTKINAPWLNKISDNQLEVIPQTINAEAKSGNISYHDINDVEQNSINMPLVKDSTNEISQYKFESEEKPLPLFLSRLIIQQNPKVVQMYEDLQSFANYPLSANTFSFQQKSFSQSAFNAWLEMTSYLNKLEQSEEESLAKSQKNAELMTELVRLEEIPKLQKENSQVVTQLHQVQEQLEQFYLDNKKLKENAAGYESELKKLGDTQNKLQKLQNELKKLDALPELEQENSMLMSQLHHVQEELERYYLENQAFKEAANRNPQELEYRAEQIKMQLPYRLGAVIVKKSKTFLGVLSLPGALLSEARAYKLERLKAPKYKKYKLNEYERNQIAIVRNHLSYRLGVVLLESVKSPLKWLTLPYKFWREIKLFKQMKRS